MKKLVFDYVMKLSFSDAVTDHRFQLRCVPASGPRQQVVDVKVKVLPETDLETEHDGFGSVVMTGFIPKPHTSFEYSVTGIAFVDNDHTQSEEFKPLYNYDSVLTVPGPTIEALCKNCREKLAEEHKTGDSMATASEIMSQVFNAFTYTPGSTTIRTTAEEALEQGTGVCQDYAHAMLAACRDLGIASRYIAGLLIGEGATHAWVEIYDNGRWVGFDPTHNRLVNDDYITISHGRDYRDCVIDIGTFSGANVEQRQWVNASVHEQVA
ncbi:transglutaminase domain-containing protein [Bifidobacterium aquikefiri]|uniref:Transglutaminase n=1 Tax=Bifidobacterium aquikefiri TaxID=1653207 RepID=A0A261GBE8_9BIFI|nr:transglutaminase family protein [Bifidobacterium aquikefiri]OZG68752.1 transglutaminase [Bifidobacterium aquikefiri]